MHSKYFDSLENSKVVEGGHILKHMNAVESIDIILKNHDDPEVIKARDDLSMTLTYCYNLLRNEFNKAEKSYNNWTYKITDSINPRGNVVHIPEAFILLQDDDNIKGGTKLWAHHMLIMINEYYRYLNKHIIERNKYPKHRRDIHSLNPDIELPKTEDEVLQWFEDTVRKEDQEGYRYFLHSIGRDKGHSYTPYEKFVKKFNDPKHIKTRTE